MKELKIGVMVTIALVILAGLIIFSGGDYLYQRGYIIKVRFDHVSGLSKGAPVRLAGMEVGEVKEMEIADKKVIVSLWLKDSAKIHTDSRITINSLGIVGEKYVEMTMGQSSDWVKDQQIINGINPVNVEEIFSRTEAIVYKGEKLIAMVDKMLGGEETWGKIDIAITNIATLTTSLNQIVIENRDNLAQAVSSMAKAGANLNKLIAENKENVRHITTQLKDASTEAKKASIQTTALLNRTLTNFDKTIVDSKRKASDTLDKIDNASAALESMLKRVENGHGVLSRIITDKKMATDLSEGLTNFNALTRDLREHPWKLMRQEQSIEPKKGFFAK